jgi:hypothetical protein
MEEEPIKESGYTSSYWTIRDETQYSGGGVDADIIRNSEDKPRSRSEPCRAFRSPLYMLTYASSTASGTLDQI